MRRNEVELLAHGVIDRLQVGQQSEDDGLVELKADWPGDHAKAARRIAAHANSARAPHILWLIGVDEGTSSVSGATNQDPAAWFDQVKACFEDGWAPAPFFVNLPRDSKTVVAILFDCGGVPFVVKNGAYLEVPWRGSTQPRSARRRELLQILLPQVTVPDIRLTAGELTHSMKDGDYHSFSLQLEVYITPQREGTVVFPYHRMKSALFAPDGTEVFEFETLFALVDDPNPKYVRRTPNIDATGSELIVAGPGRAELHGLGDGEIVDVDLIEKTCEVRFRLETAVGGLSQVIRKKLAHVASAERGHNTWRALWPMTLLPRSSGL